MAERWLYSNVKSGDTVLCLGNLPPLFRLSGRAVVFVQNRYLIDKVALDGLPFRARLRITVERIWLAARADGVDEFIVQTQSMKRLLNSIVKDSAPIHILPFVRNPEGYLRNSPKTNKKATQFDFIYIASGETHKNHRVLLQAWKQLAIEGLFPSLCLTVGAIHFGELCREIEEMRKEWGLAVTNLGELPQEQITMLYKNAGALIYPSSLESFGLPLIEARQMGLSVLAPELDYIRDILDPEQTFDSRSAISIARAVKRFIGEDEKALTILKASEFIKRILIG